MDLSDILDDDGYGTEDEREEDGLTEDQRYGRNKSTLINSAYINSGAYKRKIDILTPDAKFSRNIYIKVKEMLIHRSGTLYEDMAWFSSSGEFITEVTDMDTREGLDDSDRIRKIIYPESVKRVIKRRNDLWAFHTHPGSLPPSPADFQSSFTEGFERSFVICHNGTIYEYICNGEVIPEEFKGREENSPFAISIMYRAGNYLAKGQDEAKAHYLALKDIERDKIFPISIKFIK